MTASLTGVPAGSAPAALVLWSRWTLAGLRCNWAAGGLVGPWPCPQQKGQVQAGAERPHTLERLGELNLSHPGGLERDRGPSEEAPAPGPVPFSAPLRALSSWPSEGCRVSSSVVNVLFFFVGLFLCSVVR